MCNYVYKSATAGVSSSRRLSSFSFSCSRRGWGEPLTEHSVAGKRLRPAVELSFITVSRVLIIRRRRPWPPSPSSAPTLSYSRDRHSVHAKRLYLMLIHIRGSGAVSSPNNGIPRKCRCPPDDNCSFRSSAAAHLLCRFRISVSSTNIVYVLTFARLERFFGFAQCRRLL